MYGNSLYGQMRYGSSRSDTEPEEVSIDLMAYLPEYYQNNDTMNELQAVLGHGAGTLVYNASNALDQCFISSATEELDRWEKVFGIDTDQSKSYARRREILRAKLRGSGTTTRDMIKNVAIAFSGGEVNVIEYPSEYRFVVQFIGVLGIPENMAGLIQSIESVKPAHITYSFKYTFTVWSMLSGLTWAQVADKTWGELRIYEGE